MTSHGQGQEEVFKAVTRCFNISNRFLLFTVLSEQILSHAAPWCAVPPQRHVQEHSAATTTADLTRNSSLMSTLTHPGQRRRTLHGATELDAKPDIHEPPECSPVKVRPAQAMGAQHHPAIDTKQGKLSRHSRSTNSSCEQAFIAGYTQTPETSPVLSTLAAAAQQQQLALDTLSCAWPTPPRTSATTTQDSLAEQHRAAKSQHLQCLRVVPALVLPDVHQQAILPTHVTPVSSLISVVPIPANCQQACQGYQVNQNGFEGAEGLASAIPCASNAVPHRSVSLSSCHTDRVPYCIHPDLTTGIQPSMAQETPQI